MRERKTKIFYCDYCKKHKHTRNAMVKHELHCTMNAGRHCRTCEEWRCNDNFINILKKWRAIRDDTPAQWANEETGECSKYAEIKKEQVNQLMDDLEGCPSCTLTVLRILKFCWDKNDFDWKKEMDKLWEAERIEKCNQVGMGW